MRSQGDEESPEWFQLGASRKHRYGFTFSPERIMPGIRFAISTRVMSTVYQGFSHIQSNSGRVTPVSNIVT